MGARPDDAVSEVGSALEFTGPDFSPLRASLFSWLFAHMDTIRDRLGNLLQLHSWLHSNAEIRFNMQDPVELGRMPGGMLSTPDLRRVASDNDVLRRQGSSSEGLVRSGSRGALQAQSSNQLLML